MSKRSVLSPKTAMHVLRTIFSDSTTPRGSSALSQRKIKDGFYLDYRAKSYPSWSEKNTTSYRPTNEGCLMRIVTTPNFCKVCVEGLWLALLRRISLVDDVKLGCSFDGPTSVNRVVELELLALGQFRETPITGEMLIINWKKNGDSLPGFANLSSITVANEPAKYTAEVQLVTPEVRSDPHGYLKSSVVIDVHACSTGEL